MAAISDTIASTATAAAVVRPAAVAPAPAPAVVQSVITSTPSQDTPAHPQAPTAPTPASVAQSQSLALEALKSSAVLGTAWQSALTATPTSSVIASVEDARVLRSQAAAPAPSAVAPASASSLTLRFMRSQILPEPVEPVAPVLAPAVTIDRPFGTVVLDAAAAATAGLGPAPDRARLTIASPFGPMVLPAPAAPVPASAGRVSVGSLMSVSTPFGTIQFDLAATAAMASPQQPVVDAPATSTAEVVSNLSLGLRQAMPTFQTLLPTFAPSPLDPLVNLPSSQQENLPAAWKALLPGTSANGLSKPASNRRIRTLQFGSIQPE